MKARILDSKMEKPSVFFKKHVLKFKFVAGTSRGQMLEHVVYHIHLCKGAQVGIGECAPLPGLSIDYLPNLEAILQQYCVYFEQNFPKNLTEIFASVPEKYPSIRFAFETALLDLQQAKQGLLFETDFTSGQKPIKINGLVWMADKETMLGRMQEKIKDGFDTIKIKVGAINFEEEVDLLRYIRSNYTQAQIGIRLDANGAFAPEDALRKLEIFSEYDIHSIEQPIAVGNRAAMRKLCAQSPIPIALDEELIGVFGADREKLLIEVAPAYIILKPSLLGGLEASRIWIQFAEKMGIGWWLTSALESNIGLNAIAQFAATYSNPLAQGLGTGQLYENNIASALEVHQGYLHYRK